jgi:hypothetical protein
VAIDHSTQSAACVVIRGGGHNGDVSWLAFSIIASVVLTILLNIALRVFPGMSRRMRDGFTRLAERTDEDHPYGEPRSRVRVYFPWKAMLIGSIVLTVVINIVLALSR